MMRRISSLILVPVLLLAAACAHKPEQTRVQKALEALHDPASK